MKPITLGAVELDAIMSAAAPLGDEQRNMFLHGVAVALQNTCEEAIGPGTVARLCRDLQRQCFLHGTEGS